MELDHNGLEVLDRAECLRFGWATVGRIALTSRALPTRQPVDFRLAAPGSCSAPVSARSWLPRPATWWWRSRSTASTPVQQSGWRVVVTGVARPVVEPGDLAAMGEVRIPRWAPGPDDHVVEVTLELVSGRRMPRFCSRADGPAARAAFVPTAPHNGQHPGSHVGRWRVRTPRGERQGRGGGAVAVGGMPQRRVSSRVVGEGSVSRSARASRHLPSVARALVWSPRVSAAVARTV